MKILLVEDSTALSSALKQFFKQNNIDMTVMNDGISGCDEAYTGLYDVILLDVMLPGKDGFSVLSELRNHAIQTPILMLTARSAVPDRIQGLELGADDYVPKPFDMDELLARVRALARRRGTELSMSQHFHDVTLLADSRELEKDGSRIKLSDKEYAIMELLIRQGGHYVDKEYMTARVWSGDNSASYNSAEVYISFLRKKLKALGSQVSIKASRNVGYKLDG